MFAKKRKFPPALRVLLAAALGLALCVGGYFGIGAMLDPYDCRIAEGVTVGGLELGGMTKAEARKALQAALDQLLLTQPLTVALPEETLTISPQEAQLSADVRAAVKDAYRYGRQDGPAAKDIPLNGSYLTVNEGAIRSALEDYAARYDTAISQPRYALQGDAPALTTDQFDGNAPCQTLAITLGVPRVELDVDALCDQILGVYEAAAGCRPEDYHVSIAEIQPLEVPAAPDLTAIAEELCRKPVNDALDMQTYQLLPGAYGYTFREDSAQAAIAAAAPGETVQIPMEYVKPDILGDEVYFRDVLGECDTPHTADENRNINLGLLCASLDGLILEPGQEFSFNAAVGERTAERGYKPATAYSGTRMIKDYGGGVCQGSTTLYNCLLLADLEILERHCHGAKVGYVSLGLDAAVNWNTKTDLRFRNNFHFPIMLKAEVADGFVCMKILGTDEKDYYIEMRASSAPEGKVTYAVSYKYKYSKETGELISKDLEARSSYYPLS